MPIDRRTFLEATGASLGAVGLAGCSASPRGGPGTGPSTPGSADDRPVVGMVTEGSRYYFDPIGLFVEPGATVTWENGAGAHSSTAYREGNSTAGTTRIPEDAEAWNSGTLDAAGETFEHTFGAEGTYDYFCVPHKPLGMVGRVVVGEPGGPAEGSMPPDGSVPKSGTIVDRGAVAYDDFGGR